MTTPIPKRAPGRAARATNIPPAVYQDTPLRHELYRTLCESKLSAEEIAWQLHISPSYLRRAVLTTESGVRFPADLLSTLMQLCGDYRALALIARECDHVAVPLPRIRRAKKQPAEAVNAIAANFHALVGDLMAFAAAADSTAVAGIRARIRRHLADMAAIDRSLSTFEQMDLDLEKEIA